MVLNRISVCIALISVTMFSVTARATLLDDGSFDLATSLSQTSNSAWVLNVNFPDQNNASAQFRASGFASNDAGAPEVGVWFRSFEGNPNGGGELLADADLTQSVEAPVDGEYWLSFDAKVETFFNAALFTVSLNSSGTGGSESIDLLTTAPADGTWNNYMVLLSDVTAGDMLTVSALMTGGQNANNNPQSAFVDNFELISHPTIPEPSTSALFFLGVTSTMMCYRRTKKKIV